tara:strand:- start:8983 stop:9651 length:669 start_codon:yes stop_codon:yes gene_type:complete
MKKSTPGKARLCQGCLLNSDGKCMAGQKVDLRETPSMSMCSHTIRASDILDDVFENDGIIFFLLDKKCSDYISEEVDHVELATSAKLYGHTLTRSISNKTLQDLSAFLIKEFDAPEFNSGAVVDKLRGICQSLAVIDDEIDLPATAVILQFDDSGLPSLLSANSLVDLQNLLENTPRKTELIFSDKNRTTYTPEAESSLELFFLHLKAELTEQKLKAGNLNE